MSCRISAFESRKLAVQPRKPFRWFTVGLGSALAVSACSGEDTTGVQGEVDGTEVAGANASAEISPPPAAEGAGEELSNTSFYLDMPDGVRIAVDLWLPQGASMSQPLSTIVRATRYYRDGEVLDRAAEPETQDEAMAKSFVRGGYAYLSIDARGTGSSFGTRAQPWSPKEVADYGEIVDWIVRQPWSNGRIGAFGISYDSNTAELIATLGKEAVQAVIPRFGYPDVYADVMFPGGIFHEKFMQAWLTRARALDTNDLCPLLGLSGPDCEAFLSSGAGVKCVDADENRSLRAAAFAEHALGPDQFAALSSLEHIDDVWDGVDFGALSPGLRGQRAEQNQVPYMAWASWMDLGTARGALNRFASTDVPMTVYIGPWNHDASSDSNPYRPKDAPLEMSAEQQRALELAFFDRHLKPSNQPAAASRIVYYTLGEDVWKETPVWPPASAEVTPVYLRAEGSLSRALPVEAEPVDRYAVDFTASTGEANGWWTKLTGDDIYREDRRVEDNKLLVYTGAPLDGDTEITGHPEVTLYVSSTESDGAVFVYLEDVAPDGSVTYLTEGELRLIHRKVCTETPAFTAYGPCHSFRAEDAEPVPTGVVQEVRIGLHPVSALLRAGHSIRVAIAGHDASSFARIPAQGNPVLSVSHDPQFPSRIDLPIVPRGAAELPAR